MKQEYRIDDTEKIIYMSITGDCNLRDLETALLKLTNDKNFSPNYNLLNDLRKCKFKFRPKDLDRFFRIFIEKFSKGTGKSAVLLDTPRETAFSIIHQERMKDTREIQLFSTYEAALNWLQGG